jgi:hypothetical protein
MQYSPKLKKAMEQIKKIVQENDLAAVVILHTIFGEAKGTEEGVHVQGFTEYLFEISPSYSAAKLYDHELIVKGKKMHYKSEFARDAQMANTVNMLEHLTHWLNEMGVQADKIKSMVKTMVEVIENEGEDYGTSHTAQNN